MGQAFRAYHRVCTEMVERWGGHVAKYMGDGVLAYFGWPQAHEDEAERARNSIAFGRGAGLYSANCSCWGAVAAALIAQSRPFWVRLAGRARDDGSS